MMQESLQSTLFNAGIDAGTTSRVLDSGYFLRNWVDPFSGGRTWSSVSDFMYGSKGHSSNFKTEKFIAYIKGDHAFDALPAFRRFTVKSVEEIKSILSEPYRARLMDGGRLSFRGQTSEHTFKRHFPSPVRSDSDGREISILPGVYRQSGPTYTFSMPFQEQRSFSYLLSKLEPNNPQMFWDSPHSFDVMRVEQHYATQTAGLDLSFDIQTPIFFATHHFERHENGLASHRRVPKGEHKGVIYCFCFQDPPVKATEYLIKDFDLFKTYTPERILRQHCALPLIGPHERNIALTDLNCIFDLHQDFVDDSPLDPAWMFPGVSEDPFYKKLIEIKDSAPTLLPNLVEYEWARTT
ncbi:MAG: hypothetical protein KA152_00850 [Verrucomicrobiales bacterium]|nr:hypothetical protein [Verrucomicrobiales bacterium]